MPEAPSDVSSTLEALVARFAELLRRAGRRRGLAEQDLDELIQDVRIRLWRALETGEKISAVSASYAYRTAQTAAVDLIRRRRGKRETPLPGYTEAVPPVAAAVVAAPQLELVTRKELTQDLEAALAQLAESRRVVVRMYLAGYPREEIAKLLGWTEPKTRNLLYRGLADLRELLIARGVGPGSAA
jgi:RNA polymerase sigma-70 factor (ECF subfamily)